MRTALPYRTLFGLIAIIATGLLCGCENKPAETPTASATPMKIASPPPGYQGGAPK